MPPVNIPPPPKPPEDFAALTLGSTAVGLEDVVRWMLWAEGCVRGLKHGLSAPCAGLGEPWSDAGNG